MKKNFGPEEEQAIQAANQLVLFCNKQTYNGGCPECSFYEWYEEAVACIISYPFLSGEKIEKILSKKEN